MLRESGGRIAPWLLPADSNKDTQTAAALRVSGVRYRRCLVESYRPMWLVSACPDVSQACIPAAPAFPKTSVAYLQT